MTRRELIRDGGLTLASLMACPASGWCFWEKGFLPSGVDPQPLSVIQLPLDDPRRRQNQFIPIARLDDNRFTFGSDGTFTFFHVSDLHERRMHMGDRETVLFDRLCSRFAPSLVILTGDNVDFRCRGKFEEVAGCVVEFFSRRRIPFAVTFGNHDTEIIGEGWYSAAEQWEFYRRAAGGLFVDRHDASVLGGGSSRIQIRDSEGVPRFDLCVLDSGDYGPQGTALSAHPLFDEKVWRTSFDSVRAPQVEWAEKTLRDGIPTLFFQHIIVPEALTRLDRLSIRGEWVEKGGAVKPEVARDPVYLWQGKSIYDVWRTASNFRGAYFGHDHKNSFEGVTKDGVRLGMTKTFGSCAYNDGDLGLRVFRLHRDGSFETNIFTERHPNGLTHC